MRRRRTGLIGGLILACALGIPPTARAATGASDLPLAADLRSEAAQAARAGTPLIVIYSRADCKFCTAIKRQHLAPMAAGSRGLHIREIRQDLDTALGDFAGQPTTHAQFAAREKIKLVPVVAFYGPDGRALTESIVGARLPDFYQTYLDEAIERAARKVKQP